MFTIHVDIMARICAIAFTQFVGDLCLKNTKGCALYNNLNYVLPLSSNDRSVSIITAGVVTTQLLFDCC